MTDIRKGIKISYSEGHSKTGKISAYIGPAGYSFNRDRKVSAFDRQILELRIDSCIEKYYASIKYYNVDGHVIGSNNPHNAITEYRRVCDPAKIRQDFDVSEKPIMQVLSDKDTAWIMSELIDVAKASTCKRSKCGSVIVSWDVSIGRGYNSMPGDSCGECTKDKLDPTFKSDKTCCVHAEQRAIMDALMRESVNIRGTDLYFIRLDENDQPMKAGKPYCTICSKMALDVGISNFVLWQEEGWVSYDTKYYNELSFQYKK